VPGLQFDPSTDIEGFLAAPELEGGHVYPGRLALPDVQWRGTPAEPMATATVSLRILRDASMSRLLWTDQEKQRGIRPEVLGMAPAIDLAVADGYPDPKAYIFHADSADDLVEKLLGGQKLFLDPLIWNLRPGTFRAFYDSQTRQLYFYEARIYLPDSHHRHQALLKSYRIWAEAPEDYPAYQPTRQLQVELYFLDRDDEGEFFYQKNELTKDTAKSKAIDIVQSDSLAILTRLIVDKSPSLRGNVNRVTDRLTSSNPQVITLSTLRQMVQIFVGDSHVSEKEMERLSDTFANFYEMLAEVRSELKHLDVVDRRKVRNDLLVDSAVMMYGYVGLLIEYKSALSDSRDEDWRERLTALTAAETYMSVSEEDGAFDWRGDFFSKKNPLWRSLGVLQPTKGGGLAVSNTRQTRDACVSALRDRLRQVEQAKASPSSRS